MGASFCSFAPEAPSNGYMPPRGAGYHQYAPQAYTFGSDNQNFRSPAGDDQLPNHFTELNLGDSNNLNAFQATKFFQNVRSRLVRDYIIILDKSGSMSGGLWNQAKEATRKLTPFACQADPDGITFYLFSSPTSRHPKYENIKDHQDVEAIFSDCKPGGTTDLAGVMNQAFQEHFSKNHSPTTILVVTDGVPDDQKSVKREIISAANRILRDEELSVTFIQIGGDKNATKFLIELDDDLQSAGARFDIVDRVTSEEMNGMTFEQFINKSLDD
eukprot:TRINITY_DN4300_c0_g1_i4.p1 TRINITY_DN4300_c0_g1~~TRINITY_DN4300_c0_g1_i4.p1  ORF type:complete len:272 (-),score=78.67 TRINITY_DN4300_c0_g1_i4:23-838(-)